MDLGKTIKGEIYKNNWKSVFDWINERRMSNDEAINLLGVDVLNLIQESDEELEIMCSDMKKQILEMERFLNVLHQEEQELLNWDYLSELEQDSILFQSLAL